MNDKWETPRDLYQKLDSEFHFNFDPCPITYDSKTDVDGLLIEWGTSTFCNPPYSNVVPWIIKADKESKKGKTIVMLINAITDTKIFHSVIYNKHEIRFIEGRLKFTNPHRPECKNSNSKPSMLVIFRNKN